MVYDPPYMDAKNRGIFVLLHTKKRCMSREDDDGSDEPAGLTPSELAYLSRLRSSEEAECYGFSVNLIGRRRDQAA